MKYFGRKEEIRIQPSSIAELVLALLSAWKAIGSGVYGYDVGVGDGKVEEWYTRRAFRSS